jgi:thioredoxin 1
MVEVKQFSASWCGPCKMLTPIMNEVKEEIKETSFQYVDFQYVDVDENGDLASKYGVRGVPTVVIEKDGVEVKRFVGMKQKSELVNEIKSHL